MNIKNIKNIKFDTDKITEFVQGKLKYLPAITIIFIIILFSVLTYFAVFPKMDEVLISEGESKVRELDIRFDTKLLEELSATKSPAQLGTSGGRDPFSSF